MMAIEDEVVPEGSEHSVPRANIAKYMLHCLTNNLWEKKLVAVSVSKKK